MRNRRAARTRNYRDVACGIAMAVACVSIASAEQANVTSAGKLADRTLRSTCRTEPADAVGGPDLFFVIGEGDDQVVISAAGSTDDLDHVPMLGAAASGGTVARRGEDQLLGFYRIPEGETDYVRMTDDDGDGTVDAYYTDEWMSGLNRLYAVADGDSWSARYSQPGGSTRSFPILTFYESYEGQNNCWVNCTVGCTVCGITSLVFRWYTPAKCRSTGEYEWEFFKVVPEPEVMFASGSYFLHPVSEDPVPIVGQGGNQPWAFDDYDSYCIEEDANGTAICQHVCDGRANEVHDIVANQGCYMSCVVSIVQSAGDTITPGGMNDWLKQQPGGFVGPAVNPWAAMDGAGPLGGELSFCGLGPDGDEATLRNWICRYGPAIVGVNGSLGPNTHWVVAYGQTDDLSSFLVMDPADDGSYKRLDSLGGCNGGQFCKQQLFCTKGDCPARCASAADPASLVVQTDSRGCFAGSGTGTASVASGALADGPAEIIVIDAQGRRTGYDAETGEVFSEIPDADYSEWDQDNHGIELPGMAAKRVILRGAEAGDYTVRVSGDGVERYNLTLLSYGDGGALVTTEFLDEPVGVSGSHEFNVAFDAGLASPMTVEATCPFSCGDTTGDAVLNLADFSDVQRCFGKSPGSSIACACSDLDESGAIDALDHANFRTRFGEQVPLDEISGAACTDGLDNDCDGSADCADTDCLTDPACLICGNGVCQVGEDCVTCPADCEGTDSGPPADRFCCGNGTLEEAEGDGAVCDGNQ